MKKKSIIFSFLIALSFSQALPEDVTTLFYTEDPWGFVGKKFYDEPKASYNQFKKRLLRGIVGFVGTTGTAAGTGYLGYKVGNHFKNKYNSELNIGETVSIFSAIGGGVLGLSLSYGVLNAFMKREADRQALRKFLNRWDEFKKFTPPSLHPAFKAIYNEYTKNGWEEVVENTADITKEIRKQLAKNDDRYATLYQSNEEFFNARYFALHVDVDIANILKIMWQILTTNNQRRD